jgi:DNA-binding MarR family transcriptional regulator
MPDIYNNENFSPSENIGFLLKFCGTQLSLSVDRALAEFDMTHAQLGIFLRLLNGTANTATDLARVLMTDTGAMTRMLDRLEDKAFIERSRNGEDRRVVQVKLTSKGEALADQMTQATIGCLNHYLRGFSPADVTQFTEFLRRMIANA